MATQKKPRNHFCLRVAAYLGISLLFYAILVTTFAALTLRDGQEFIYITF